MKRLTAAIVLSLLTSSASWAVDLTISTAPSVRAAPTASVSRNELAPPAGVTQAPARQRPAYAVVNTRQVGQPTLVGKVPFPIFNPAPVSFCEVDLD
jgi:hypothetical protein